MVPEPSISAESLTPFLNGRDLEQLWNEYETKGFVVFEGIMPGSEIKRVRTALNPYLSKTGRNDFEGFKSNRVYALLAKSPDVFSDMITHPLALYFAERELGRSCLLSALLAIKLHPGETVQPWHCDDQQVMIPRPRPAFGVSTFWTIDPMNEDNGATQIIPGSHLWEDDGDLNFDRGAELFDPSERDVHHDPAPHPDMVQAIMPAGSLMIMKSSVYHRGGANRSGKSRLIVTPQYCAGWSRQLENMAIAIPPEKAAKLSKRVRELVGYSIHDFFMGYVDGVHPDKSLGL
ncbi:MAG: phytanoyl-CoA dioxygenase family protein [Hellea sp.]|nr:phytanoyl-CoA dioxygenase family protein [Hellea sp.]